MILPAEFDLEKPDDELVEMLVSSGPYTKAQAVAVVELMRDPDAEPLE